MSSRYFTRNVPERHFANESSYVEITDDGRYIVHRDDETAQDRTIRGPTRPLDVALSYVKSGHWIELSKDDLINQKPRVVPCLPDMPATVGDHW